VQGFSGIRCAKYFEYLLFLRPFCVSKQSLTIGYNRTQDIKDNPRADNPISPTPEFFNQSAVSAEHHSQQANSENYNTD
jgi:hypothetical protein